MPTIIHADYAIYAGLAVCTDCAGYTGLTRKSMGNFLPAPRNSAKTKLKSYYSSGSTKSLPFQRLRLVDKRFRIYMVDVPRGSCYRSVTQHL